MTSEERKALRQSLHNDVVILAGMASILKTLSILSKDSSPKKIYECLAGPILNAQNQTIDIKIL